MSFGILLLLPTPTNLERVQLKFAVLCYNRFVPHVHYTLYTNQNSIPYARGGFNLMHSFLFKFISVLSSVLPFRQLLVFESQHGFSETLLCLIIDL